MYRRNRLDRYVRVDKIDLPYIEKLIEDKYFETMSAALRFLINKGLKQYKIEYPAIFEE